MEQVECLFNNLWRCLLRRSAKKCITDGNPLGNALSGLLFAVLAKSQPTAQLGHVILNGSFWEIRYRRTFLSFCSKFFLKF